MRKSAEIDNSEEALTDDQLQKRYELEAAQLSGSMASFCSSAAQMASPSLPSSPAKSAKSAQAQGSLPHPQPSPEAAQSKKGQRSKKRNSDSANVGGNSGDTESKRRAVTSTISDSQRTQATSECEAIANRFTEICTAPELTEWETGLMKCLKNIDKKKALLLNAKVIDPRDLDFQLTLDDHLNKLTLLRDFTEAYHAFTGDKPAGGSSNKRRPNQQQQQQQVQKQYPSGAFKVRIDALAANGIDVPPLFQAAKFTMLAHLLREQDDSLAFLRHIASTPPPGADHSSSTTHIHTWCEQDVLGINVSRKLIAMRTGRPLND